jgi:hypothetical protein
MPIESLSVSKHYSTEDIQRMISETSERDVVRALYEKDNGYLLINISLFSKEIQELVLNKLLRDKKEVGAYLILNHVEYIPSLSTYQVIEICKFGYGKWLVNRLHIGTWGKEYNTSKIIRCIAKAGVKFTKERVRTIDEEFNKESEMIRISRNKNKRIRKKESKELHSKILRQKIALSQCLARFEEITDIDPDVDRITLENMFEEFRKLYCLPEDSTDFFKSFIDFYYDNRKYNREAIQKFTDVSGNIDKYGVYDYYASVAESVLPSWLDREDVSKVELGKYSIRFYFKNYIVPETGKRRYSYLGLSIGHITSDFIECIDESPEYFDTDSIIRHEEQHAFRAYLRGFFDSEIRTNPRKINTNQIVSFLTSPTRNDEKLAFTEWFESYNSIEQFYALWLDSASNEILAYLSNEEYPRNTLISLFDNELREEYKIPYDYPEYYKQYIKSNAALNNRYIRKLKLYKSSIETGVDAAFSLIDYLKTIHRDIPYEVIYLKAKNFLTLAPLDQWKFWVDEYIRSH